MAEIPRRDVSLSGLTESEAREFHSIFMTSFLIFVAIAVVAVPAGSVFWQGIFAVASFLITMTLFVVVYRFMPKAEVTLRDTLPGAIIGGLLWETAKYVFAWSLNYFHYDQIYGSVGAVVAVLTWSYVSSLILLFGAQLSAVFHREHPHYPSPIAVPIPQ